MCEVSNPNLAARGPLLCFFLSSNGTRGLGYIALRHCGLFAHTADFSWEAGEMSQAKKDVLAALEAELAFVERGGYGSPQQASWRRSLSLRIPRRI